MCRVTFSCTAPLPGIHLHLFACHCCFVAPAVLFSFAVLLRALLSRIHLAHNACAQCAVFTADGTVKDSTFDVIAAVSALLRRGSHLLPRLVPKRSPPSPKLGMTGTTRCNALPPSPNPLETLLSRLPSQPSPSRSPTRPSRACRTHARAPPFRHARRHRSATA
jgi:hypothetical protein